MYIYKFTTYVGCDFGCKHFQFLKITKAENGDFFLRIWKKIEKKLKNARPILYLQAAEIFYDLL